MNDDYERVPEKPVVEIKTAIRIILAKGDATLIEWDAEGDVKRAYVKGKPSASMTARELSKAQPYGEDWAAVFPFSFGRAFSVDLHRLGIWTFADIALHRAAVQKSLWAALGVDQLIRESRRS